MTAGRVESHRTVEVGAIAPWNGTSTIRTMLEGVIDRSEPGTIHEQVAAQIRRAIADGEAGPGERLPLAKDMAAILRVNKNTVLRALHTLRDEGLLEFTRGRGITVAGTPEKSAVVRKAKEMLEFARTQGYGHSEVVALIESLADRRL